MGTTRRLHLVSLAISILALICLFTATAWGFQSSMHQKLIEDELEQMSNQHSNMASEISADSEHLRDLDRQLASLNEARIPERVAKMESETDNNTKLLIGILLSMILLVVEAILRHAGPLKRVA